MRAKCHTARFSGILQFQSCHEHCVFIFIISTSIMVVERNARPLFEPLNTTPFLLARSYFNFKSALLTGALLMQAFFLEVCLCRCSHSWLRNWNVIQLDKENSTKRNNPCPLNCLMPLNFLRRVYIFSGTCFVGNQSSKSLLALVIIPEAICLLLGSVFLASGLRAVVRRPAPVPAPAALLNAPPQPHTDQSVLRLGAFAALYAVPSACILATWIYEYAWRDEWLAAPVPSTEPSTHPQPAFWVFLFRIFATQILGVMVAVWIATPRLKAFWRRITGPRKPVLAKCLPGPAPTPLSMSMPCYASHPHSLSRHSHKYATYRPPQQHSYRKPRHYHYSAGETILWPSWREHFVTLK